MRKLFAVLIVLILAASLYYVREYLIHTWNLLEPFVHDKNGPIHLNGNFAADILLAAAQIVGTFIIVYFGITRKNLIRSFNNRKTLSRLLLNAYIKPTKHFAPPAKNPSTAGSHYLIDLDTEINNLQQIYAQDMTEKQLSLFTKLKEKYDLVFKQGRYYESIAVLDTMKKLLADLNNPGLLNSVFTLFTGSTQPEWLQKYREFESYFLQVVEDYKVRFPTDYPEAADTP